MTQNKMVGVLKSRKFWGAVVSLLVSAGLVAADMEAQTTEALVTLVTVVGGAYILGTGIEDISKGGT